MFFENHSPSSTTSSYPSNNLSYILKYNMPKELNIKIIRTLCILTAILWSILSILSIYRGSHFLIPTVMFVSVVLELLFFFLLKKTNKSILISFLVFTLFNLILTITDQMGIWDFILLGIYISKIVMAVTLLYTNTKK